MSEKYLLTYEEAKERKHNVDSPQYELKLCLTKGDHFAGYVKVNFVLRHPGSNVWLDFCGKSVNAIKVNEANKEVDWKDNRITLHDLVEGHNTVEIWYENKYSNDGYGLHKYVDPADNEIYCYTQFEPFAANRLLPCFDQPDLKATLNLWVTAPADWIVVANENATEKTTPDLFSDPPPRPSDQPTPTEPETLHIFPTTPKISTYLYALVAGGYEEFRKDENDVQIPLGLFCRKSMKQYLVPERYFHWTVEGLKFYNDFFGIKYPFNKYDQIFVPEFNMGAMENVGCVTYRDQYIFKDPPSYVQLIRVCDTFLHEMAHMWFGNLVTMKWWDDLWLNESFATFMSHLCVDLQLGSEYPSSWREFLGMKGWGYATDQLSTTHPISTPVRDTNETESNFDGISYAKGSSVLKQLYFLVQHNTFKMAIQKYMNDFQFKNAEFSDLIKYIAEETTSAGLGIDIHEWAESWVKTAGLNEMLPIIEKDASGKVTRFAVKQTPALEEHPTLRNHKIIVQAWDANANSLINVPIQIQPQEVTEFTELQGLEVACVLLNVGDWGYCKIRIDEESLEFFKNNLCKIQDSLSRQLVWRALWDMTRDIRISAVEFLDAVKQQVPQETLPEICNYVLEISTSALSNYIPDEAQEAEAKVMLKLVLDKVREYSDKPEALIFQKRVPFFIKHPEDISMGISWVTSNDTGIPNYTLGQLDRWAIIKKYSALTSEAKEIVEQERQKDNSDSGHLSKLFCEAAYPEAGVKEEVWNRVVNSGHEMSRYERENAMAGFNIRRQKSLLGSYTDKYFETALEILNSRDKEFSKDFCECMLPRYADEGEVIEKINALLPKLPEDRFEVIRHYKEETDFLKKYKAGKELSAKVLSERGQ